MAILPGELPPGRTKTTNATKALRTDLEGAYKGNARTQRNLDSLQASVTAGGNPGTITVKDALGNTAPGTGTLSMPLGIDIGSEVSGVTTLVHDPYYPFDYDTIAFTAMNIGGSNEVERVRTLVDFKSWEDMCLTCSATSDINGFELELEYYDLGFAAWTGTGIVLTFPASQNIDTDGGFVVGDFANAAESAIAQGVSTVRVRIDDGSAADDIYGLHLVQRRVHRI